MAEHARKTGLDCLYGEMEGIVEIKLNLRVCCKFFELHKVFQSSQVLLLPGTLFKWFY